LAQRRDLGLDHAHRHADGAALEVSVHTVTGQAGDLVREVRVLLALEDLLRFLGGHLLEKLRAVCGVMTGNSIGVMTWCTRVVGE
jgi:hypothetical protein